MRFSTAWRASSFPEEVSEGWCEEVVANGRGTCESVERTDRKHLAHRNVDVEATDGGSSRQERIRLVISFPGG